jgi:clan AA aspartic protease (TIGR02281 family)
VEIHIGPNITDKWPDKRNVSKPGLESTTLDRFPGLTDGLDIYIWERAVEVGGGELGGPLPSQYVKNQLMFEIGHALDNCLNLSSDKQFQEQYNLDKDKISAEDKRRLKFFLQPDGVGEKEVLAAAIVSTLRSEPVSVIDEHFKLARDWVKTRLEREYRKPVSRLASLRATAAAGIKSASLASSKTGTDSSANEKEATLSMPAEERIPYIRQPGDHLFVRGEINGRSTQILIDTGAFKVVVGKNHLVKLGIKPPEGNPEIIGSGAAGALKGWEMPLEISIGRIKRKLTAQVIEGDEVMLLGQPFLSGLHYRIDRGSNYIHFTKDSKALQKEMSYDSVEIPFRMQDGNLMVPVKVNGVSTEMNFDTGAPYCLFSMDSMWRLRLRPVSEMTIRGAGGSAASGYACYVESMQLGSIRKQGFSVAVSPSCGQNVLGQDFFGQRRFIIDNENKVLRIAR